MRQNNQHQDISWYKNKHVTSIQAEKAGQEDREWKNSTGPQTISIQ